MATLWSGACMIVYDGVCTRTGVIGGRGCHRGWCSWWPLKLCLDLIEANLLLQGAFQLVADVCKLADGRLEGAQGLAQPSSGFRKALGAKDEQGNNGDDERFGRADAEKGRRGLLCGVVHNAGTHAHIPVLLCGTLVQWGVG